MGPKGPPNGGFCVSALKSHKEGVEIMNKGFTIVELLIVIVVIAVLATMTIVVYNGITAKA